MFPLAARDLLHACSHKKDSALVGIGENPIGIMRSLATDGNANVN